MLFPFFHRTTCRRPRGRGAHEECLLVPAQGRRQSSQAPAERNPAGGQQNHTPPGSKITPTTTSTRKSLAGAQRARAGPGHTCRNAVPRQADSHSTPAERDVLRLCGAGRAIGIFFDDLKFAIHMSRRGERARALRVLSSASAQASVWSSCVRRFHGAFQASWAGGARFATGPRGLLPRRPRGPRPLGGVLIPTGQSSAALPAFVGRASATHCATRLPQGASHVCCTQHPATGAPPGAPSCVLRDTTPVPSQLPRPRMRPAGRRRGQSSNLVDPASSHMLVSKIKPCMSKYKLLYGETANGSLKQLSSPWQSSNLGYLW